MRLDANYFESSYEKQAWLTEMHYLTSLTEVDKMLVFDFDYFFIKLLNDEKERREKEKKD